MGRSNGTAFVDITNPTAPKYVANLPKFGTSASTLWREPKVYGNYAYIGVDGTSHPMQVVDLTQLRNYSGTTLNLTASANYSGVGTATINAIHTLAINNSTGYLYAAGTNRHSGGLHVIDVRNPSAPVFAGGWAGDGYIHETQVVTYHGPDTQYQGREIAFNSAGKFDNSDTVSIVDVTNKSAMTRLAARSYPNVGYIHQGWLTEDHRYFFQNDEFDEADGSTGGRTRTHLWDVSDLDNPVYKGFYDHLTTSIDHNLYVKGGYLFETNYTTGLRILKIGNLASGEPSQWLTEVAYYDTYSSNDGQTYNGAWNNYPFFASGNVVISDIDGGLFVVRPDLPGWDDPYGNGTRKPLPGGAVNLVPEPSAPVVMMIMGMGLLRRRRMCI
jgi:choice-of-anchor B domain-containing protein